MAYSFALQAVEEEQVELIISASPPPTDWFATPLAADAAAVIVHPDNPLRNLSVNDVYALFSGLIINWEEMEGSDDTVQMIILLEGDELRGTFEAALPITYSPPPNAILAPSPEAVLEMVEQTPGAIGYVPFSIVDEETFECVISEDCVDSKVEKKRDK